MKIVFKEYSALDEKQSLEILEIRNLDYIRKNMINDEIISLENHLFWMDNLKDNIEKKYFAVVNEEKVLGSCSWIKRENEFIWGVFFKNEISPIISSVSVYLFLDNCFFNDKIEILISLIKKENKVAFNFNKNFGFELYKEDEEYFYLKLQKQNWENNKNSRLLKPIKNYLGKIEYEFQ